MRNATAGFFAGIAFSGLIAAQYLNQNSTPYFIAVWVCITSAAIALLLRKAR